MENLKLQQWPVEKIHQSTHAVRLNDEAIPRMTDALRMFGFRVPLLITADGEVVDGHLRLKAALAMGMTSVPVIVVDDMTPTQIRTFRLLVNRSATWAEWDKDALRVELTDLRDLDVDLSLTGFADAELDAFLQGIALEREANPDAVPPFPEVPTSRTGDLWILGVHRLLCGDSTSKIDIATLMGGEQADMLWTDPPYNVDYKGKAGKIRNDKMSAEAFDSFLYSLLSCSYDVLTDGGAAYVAHSEVGGGSAFRTAFAKAGYKLASCLVWRKHQLVLSRADYHWQHEPILYGWKPTGRHRFYGNRKQTTLLEHFKGHTVLPAGDGVWQIATGDAVLLIKGDNITVEEIPTTVLAVPKPSQSKLHPTMKPVALVERMVANSSPRGGLVLDSCGGSGTSIIACERLGRRCNAMEIDPKFADVIVMRWQEATGKIAVLAGGASFADVQAEREVSHD